MPGVAELDDPASRAAVEMERAVLAALEAGCAAPVGATARVTDSELACSANVYAIDGSRHLSSSRSRRRDDFASLAEAAATVAEEVTQELLEQGAADLVAATDA